VGAQTVSTFAALLLACAGTVLVPTAPALAAAAEPQAAPPSLAEKTFGAWGLDLSGMDRSVNPGDDFDRYMNGAWEAKTEIPADQPSAGVGYDAFNLTQLRARALVENLPASTQVGAMYRSFMDEAKVEALDDRPLQADLARVEAIKDKAGFTAFMGEGIGRFGAALWELAVDADPAQPALNTLWLGQAGLNLPDRDYYLKDTFKPQRAAYRAYLEQALTMVGHPEPAAHADAILAFETAIAQVSWAVEDRRDIDKINNPMTPSELQAYAPGVDWKGFLASSGLPAPTRILVNEKSAIRDIAALYAATPLDTLKAWQAAQITFQAAPYLSRRFVDGRFAFTRQMSGVTTQRPRWKRGSALVDRTLGEALGRAYVAQYFPPASKAMMEQLVANLKQAMAARIAGAAWMSPATRQAALDKLARMEVMVGYQEHWRDDAALKVDSADLYGNVQRAGRFDTLYHFAELGKPVDRKKWSMSPQTVNAYNGFLENKIVFPAGILQAPFFNPKADPAVNYGAIGAIIGHEISHGFDDQGRKVDASGAVRDWWTAQDAERFNAQAKGFGAQYDQYEPVKGTHVNGNQTMGENIADLAGVLVAFDAYKTSLGGRPAPVLDGLTGEQRFFLSFAQVERGKVREDSVRQQVTSDPHTPRKFRIVGPVRNVDAWYEAFGVKGGAYFLKPEERARIW